MARILDRGTTLVVTLVLAAKLGVAGVGTYSLALAVYGAISIAGEGGTTLFLTRELAIDRSRTGSYIVHLSTLALGVSLVLTLAGEGVVHVAGYSAEVQTSLSLVLLAIFPKTLNSIQEATFIVYGRTEFEAVTTLVSSVVYIAVSVVLLTQGFGVSAVVLAYVALEYLATIVYFVLIVRSIVRPRLRLEWPLMRRLAVEIRAFAASSVLASLFARPEIIILSLLSTTREVGYYSAAVRISEIWLFVPEVFLDNVYPVLARAYASGGQQFRKIQANAVKYGLAYALPVTAALIALATPIIRVLFGREFGHSEVAVRVLALNVAFFTLTEVFWRSASARGHQSTVLRVQSLVIASRLLAGTALIGVLASLGAAIATSLTAALQAALLARLVRTTGVPTGILRAGWRLAIAAAIMGGGALLLAQWLSIWIVIPIAAVIYVAAALLLRAFSAEELSMLNAALPRRTAVAR